MSASRDNAEVYTTRGARRTDDDTVHNDDTVMVDPPTMGTTYDPSSTPMEGTPYGHERTYSTVDTDATADASAAETDDDTEDAEEAPPEVEEIRTEIEQTRAEMSTTIDAIQERLNPQRLMADAQDQVHDVASRVVAEAQESVRDATIGKAERVMNDATEMVSNAGENARGAGYSLRDAVRRNPVPAALAALGLGWLFMSARGEHEERSRREMRYGGYRAATYYPPYGARRE